MMRILAGLALAASVSACATQPVANSYVGGLSSGDGAGIAIIISKFAASRIRPVTGPVHVAAAAQDKIVYPWLVADLGRAGFVVADPAPHQLYYNVQPFEGVVLIHVVLDNLDATEVFEHARFGLFEPVAPVLVREIAP